MQFRRSVLLALLLLTAWGSAAQTPGARSLLVSVADENGVTVRSALLLLTNTQTGRVWRCQADFAGRCRFTGLPPGLYSLQIQKPGFYLLNLAAMDLRTTQNIDATLAHQQEIKQTVNVTASPPAISATQVASTGTLTENEVLNVPYPTSRDVRNVRRYIPGVVQDPAGRFHVDGAADYQNAHLLDGFEITNPVTRALDMRFSADAVRAVDVERSRVSAQFGKETGGVMAFTTGMGDDRFRISGTNFIPSVQGKKGLNFDKFVPRATISGPIIKGRAWFFFSPEFEYDQDIVKQLPDGADRNFVLRGSNLAKVQVNLSQRNIFTSSFLYNRLHSGHDGLNQFQPMPTTLNVDQNAYLFDLKDQHYFQNGAMLEVGAASNQFHVLDRPQGPLPLVVTPNGQQGNYFKASRTHSGRLQALANLYLPPLQRWGKHEFQLGVNLDRLTMNQTADRRPTFVLRADGTLQREITFANAPPFRIRNREFSAYAQDRWTPVKPLLLELGLRFDRDQVVHRPLLSPRLAATYMLTADGNTKLSAGVGWFYDATNLNFLAQPLNGQRFDQLFASDGVTPQGPPLVTTFAVNRAALHAPRFLNYSVGLDRKLPGSIYLRTEFLRKRGTNGFVFLNTTNALLGGNFLLANTRHDHFDSFRISAERAFKETYELFVSYTRSSARSNQVFDFNLDNPVFSPQGPGPLPWNTPNRLLAWGWVPVPRFKGWSFQYSVEAHSGFAFSAVNQNQQIVGAPNSYRFPAFVTIDPFLEYRFRFKGHNLALRGGIQNITGHRDPMAVNNNIDSPQFLTFSGFAGRVFTTRIRFLGTK